MSAISCFMTFICSLKNRWALHAYLFVGVRDVHAGFEKEQWSGMGGPCMMAYIEIGLNVGYALGVWMQSLPGVGCREGYIDS